MASAMRKKGKKSVSKGSRSAIAFAGHSLIGIADRAVNDSFGCCMFNVHIVGFDRASDLENKDANTLNGASPDTSDFGRSHAYVNL
jgi:hypothetical protein